MIEVGDVVRCLDFPGRYDCFIVGEVLEVYEEYFVVRAVLRVVAGVIRENGVPGIYEVPMMGKALFEDAGGNRVVVMCSPDYVDEE